MGFDRFDDLLDHQGFFFSRLDCHSDPLEGVSTMLYEPSPVKALSPEEERVRKFCEEFDKTVTNQIREQFMINCWTLNHIESAPMWEEY